MSIFAIMISLNSLLATPGSHETQSPKVSNQIKEIMKDTTDWEIMPSFKYDLLCFLNTLTGDPYYLECYNSEYAKFEPKLTPEAKDALAHLKKVIKDENGGIISAFLCLYFSAVDDETIDQMLITIENPSILKQNFMNTPYYSEDDWKLFDSVRPDLKKILLFLKNIDFYNYWKASVLPLLNKGIEKVQLELPKYDVIREDEKVLGSKLSSNQITVYMLYYSQPHGIKITGTRFLTNVAWPFDIVVRNACHEMMHPPYDLKSSPKLVKALDGLKEDSFLMDKVTNHNPSFGYNSFEGFIEEDCVQALDQLVSESLNIAQDPRERWSQADDGMHVFAVCLYSVMKDEGYNRFGESFGDFLLRMIKEGKFSAGNLKAIYDKFYS